jgi:hypothetical protein
MTAYQRWTGKWIGIQTLFSLPDLRTAVRRLIFQLNYCQGSNYENLLSTDGPLRRFMPTNSSPELVSTREVPWRGIGRTYRFPPCVVKDVHSLNNKAQQRISMTVETLQCRNEHAASREVVMAEKITSVEFSLLF